MTSSPRCVSPDLSLPHLSSSPESLLVLERQDSRSPSPMLSPSVMYKLLIPLLRCEVSDMRDSVVQALGNINHNSLMDLLGEKTMLDYIREELTRYQWDDHLNLIILCLGFFLYFHTVQYSTVQY